MQEKPSARNYFLTEYMPKYFSMKTYEEYVFETTRSLGRLKGDPQELVAFHEKFSLDKLRFSNSTEINFVCENIYATMPSIQDLLKTCFVAVTPKTIINASAYYKDRPYAGHIIEISAGIFNWFAFFLAPLITLSWILYQDSSRQEKDTCLELFERQKKDLIYLKGNNAEFRAINKLERSWFPYKEMWMEYTLCKNATYTFITLHEIGHHLLKHTKGTYSELFEVDLRSYVPRWSSENHKSEFEADYFAVRKILESKVTSFPVGSIQTLLGLIYLLDSFEEPSDTHPSLKQRLEACIGFYLENFDRYKVESGMYITREYAIALFGQDTKVVASWDNWWRTTNT